MPEQTTSVAYKRILKEKQVLNEEKIQMKKLGAAARFR